VARFAVLAAMLCGCAQLFGLDETSGSPQAVSLTVQRASVGARVVLAPQDLAASTGKYLVPSEADPTGLLGVLVAQAEPGLWIAPVTGATPILFELPDYPKPIPRLYDFPRPGVKGLFAVLEHPSPQPAPMNATIAVNATLDTAFTGAERFELQTLGSWNAIALTPPAVGTAALTQTFAFTAMTSITGRPHERITADDAAVVLRYVGNELRAAFKAPPFEQIGTDTITGTLIAVDVQPFTVAIDQADLMRRYSAARPLVGTPTLSWTLRAAPGAQLNIDNGPLLASGAPTDMTAISSQAGNPFAPDWPSVLLWQTQATRSYTPPSAGLPVSLLAGMFERAVLAPGLEMKLPAGFPAQIAIGGASLESDGVTIPKPTRAVEVTFMADVPTNTMYQLHLYKLVPNAGNTALVPELKLSASGGAPRFVLPPDLFEANAFYTLRAQAVQGGFPAIAEGDLTQRTLPLASSFLDSGVFLVKP
jgi:hypothetical protein